MRKVARLGVVGVVGAFLAWGLTGTRAAPSRASPSPEPPPTPAVPALMRAPAVAAVAATPTPTPPPSPIALPSPERPWARPKPSGKAVIASIPALTTPASIGTNEVTVTRFRACVQAGSCKSEQFIADAGLPCNWGIEGHGEHPMNCVDWTGASAFCAFDGGRLCKPDEWFAACRGPSDRDYPYGAAFDANACLAHSGPPTPSSGTEPVGSRASCQGGTPGVHDMAGNVSEWVDDCDGTYCHFYGGAYLTNEPVETFASCKKVCAGNQKTLRSSTLGIRCCYDTGTKG